MDRAAIFAQFGAPERTAIVCDSQTAGRGRGGRNWQSAPGALYATLILRPHVPPDRLSTLSLIVGVAVAEAIEAVTGAPVRLKWPNDVWLGQDQVRKKVAGILVTSSLSGSVIDYVLVGVGINVSSPLANLPDGATSILAATGLRVGTGELLAVLLGRVDAGYGEYIATKGRPPLREWRKRAALLGEDVMILDGNQNVSGRFAGIDDDGALLLDQGCQTHRIVGGDLVRGPRPSITAAQPGPSR